MRIQVLGPGCAKCRELAANARRAVEEAGIDVQVEQVEDIREIAKFGVMVTPALAIDGRVKSVGRVLSPADVRKYLRV